MEGLEVDSAEVSVPKKEELSSNDSINKKRVSFFGLFYAADKLDYVLMFFGTVGVCLHGASIPVFFVLFGQMIDTLGHGAANPQYMSSQVIKYSLYLLYLGLVIFVSSWIGVAFWMQTGERQTAHLRLMYLQSVLRKDMSFFDTEARDSNLIHHITSDAIIVQDAIGDKTGHAVRYLAQCFVGFAVGFLSVWQLTLLTLAVIPLIVVVGGTYAIIMSIISEKSEAAHAEAGKVAEEVISQVRTVYSFVGEDKSMEAYSKSLNNALKLGKKIGLAKGIGIGCTFGVLICSWSFLLWYSGILVRHGKTNGGKAFTVIFNAIFSGFSLGQAAPNISAIARAQAAVANITSMIKTESGNSKRPEDGIVLPKVAGNIEFSDVCFAYPSRTNMVFEKLSFSVSSGKAFALVGPSGSGKSTVISMIQRFYNPTSGKILLDGHDLKTLQLKWFREQVGLVNQEPALFAMSIADNILFGKRDADMDEVIQAAKAANADSFIRQLPDGYDTQVGEGGTQLSGGQKQRIGIARAVLRNPTILLLDEATSALDTESEIVVQQALDKIMPHRTTIIVAHRLSTIRDVYRIFVFKDGQIVESGNHSELVSLGGEYATMLNLQASDQVTGSIVKSHSVTAENPSLREALISQDKELKSNFSRELVPTEKTLSLSDFPSSPLIWELVKLNAPEWPNALLGSIGAILAGMQAPLFSLLMTHVLAALYSPDFVEMKHQINRMMIILFLLAVSTVLINLLQGYFFIMMGEGITVRVRLEMFSAILRNEIGWFDLDDHSTGSLTSALASSATLVRGALADSLSTIVQNVSLVVTAFAISFTFSWRLTAVVGACFPLLVGASIGESLFLRGFGGGYHAYIKANALASEAIANIRTVAAFGAEEIIPIQFARELDEPNKKMLLRGHVSGFGYGISQLLSYCSYAIGLWYGSVLIKHKDSNFQQVIKSFMVLLITSMAVSEALSVLPSIVKGSQALGSVFSILHRKTEIDANIPASREVTDIKGEIEFRNVKFKYPVRPDVTVFQDLNLRVSAGKSLAVVGQSGSGKSTIISLILRFYDPISGAILIDGYNIRTLNLKSLRRRIGLVQQEPALFSTTIYENIKYGKDNASEIEVMKAAQAANAHGFISRMPEGYKTHVGNKGLQLSGGQKQRVAIARAILKNPAILLLDEATSALDTASEKVVQDALDVLMQGRTTILVAHRLSTVRDADSIAVIQEGKVGEIGSHKELIEKPDGIYKQLVSLQQEQARKQD